MKIKKRVGPKQDPWETPWVTGKEEEQYLKIGITLAIFNEDGKIPNRSELLKKSVRHGAIISATYLRKRLGMLTAPTAFPSFRVASSIVTSFTVIGLKNMDWLTCLPIYILKPFMSLQNLSARLEPPVEKYLLNS
uniref:uncharacterized protein LOC120334120 n=1 Tax=Styela clava TaxID=7725 RepID=UPI001939CFC4|nr:uncharacterized protein LOC120334120 [Styela clava]